MLLFPVAQSLAHGEPAGIVLALAPFNASVDLNQEAMATILGPEPYIGAGCDADQAGDVNDDGYADLVTGTMGSDESERDSGRVWLLQGPFSGTTTLDIATATIDGDQEGLNLGYRVIGAGDLNGDGYSDIAVAAPHRDQLGDAKTAVYGPGHLSIWYGPLAGSYSAQDADIVVAGDESLECERIGQQMTSTDMDRDGLDDLLIAMACEDGNSVAILHGPGTVSESMAGRLTDRLRVAQYLTTTTPQIVPADINGDNHPDLVVWNMSYVQSQVMLVLGPMSGTIDLPDDADLALDHTWNIASAGDIDADGLDELLVRDYRYSQPGVAGSHHGQVAILDDWLPEAP